MIRIGEKNSFIVVRKSDLGYMLSNKDEQLLLHFNQTNGQELEINSMIECFVQYDSKGRISATLEEPTVTMSMPGWAKVVEVNARLGIFVSIGTFKDILISKDNLPLNTKLWPEIDEVLYVKLTHVKGRLNALLMTKNEIVELNPNVPNITVGSRVNAVVVRTTPNAVNAITLDDKTYIYISNKQFRGTYRIGQEVDVMIIGRHDDELVGSLNKVKEELVVDDEKIILDYLKEHDGMPYSAKTSAEEIEEVFHMSRKAFKRALGDLYKKREIYFEGENTYLTKK